MTTPAPPVLPPLSWWSRLAARWEASPPKLHHLIWVAVGAIALLTSAKCWGDARETRGRQEASAHVADSIGTAFTRYADSLKTLAQVAIVKANLQRDSALQAAQAARSAAEVATGTAQAAQASVARLSAAQRQAADPQVLAALNQLQTSNAQLLASNGELIASNQKLTAAIARDSSIQAGLLTSVAKLDSAVQQKDAAIVSLEKLKTPRCSFRCGLGIGVAGVGLVVGGIALLVH